MNEPSEQTVMLTRDLMRAVDADESLRIGCVYPQVIDPKILRRLLNPALGTRRMAQYELLGPLVGDVIDQLEQVYKLSCDPSFNETTKPIKDFYPLDEDVPGGRHEVRLLRHMGKAVGRFVVPMDGEWSPPFDRVNVHYDRALAAYKQMLEAQNPH